MKDQIDCYKKVGTKLIMTSKCRNQNSVFAFKFCFILLSRFFSTSNLAQLNHLIDEIIIWAPKTSAFFVSTQSPIFFFFPNLLPLLYKFMSFLFWSVSDCKMQEEILGCSCCFVLQQNCSETPAIILFKLFQHMLSLFFDIFDVKSFGK